MTYRATVTGDRLTLDRSELSWPVPSGEPVVVTAPDFPDPVILIQVDETTWRAVTARCTHLGCQVRPSRQFLRCPCHGSTFDLNGRVVRGPAQKALVTYPVEIKEDRIEIIVS
jgi:Rieske Fe-S protein